LIVETSIARRIAGWWGVRASGASRWRRSTSAAAGAAALHIARDLLLARATARSLELIAERAASRRCGEKSLRSRNSSPRGSDAELAPLGFAIVTPRGALARGGHLALAHPERAAVAARRPRASWRISRARSHPLAPRRCIRVSRTARKRSHG